MATTIDIEARRFSNLLIDEDKFRRKYKDKDKTLSIIFSSPYLEIFEKNRFYLLKESIKKVLETKYYYRPDYLSYEEYGSTSLWYLLLYINDISCIENFNKYEILIPSYSSILRLTKDKVTTDIQDLSKVKDSVPISILNLYSSKVKPNLDVDDTNDEGEEDVRSSLFFARQKFTITAGQESNGYLDLAFVPVIETIVFKTEHAGNHIYNIDYVVIENPTDHKIRRISWKDSDCGDGPGLLGTLKEGMVVEITYAKMRFPLNIP